MKTFSAKPTDIKRQWYVLDASEAPLGRLSTVVASLLLGKGKPSLTPHMDGGDYAIVINAERLVVTGNKLNGKIYYRHSGYPGGIYQRTLSEQVQLDPTKAIISAVRGMLPDNKLRKGRLARLNVYAGAEHTHGGQNPTEYKFERKVKS